MGWITNYIRSEVLKVVSINITVFWVVQTEAGCLFKMWEPAYQTKWHPVPNYCIHDIIKLSYRQSFMICLFLIQLHEATKHYPNVIMVSFQNQHWILEQEGHNGADSNDIKLALPNRQVFEISQAESCIKTWSFSISGTAYVPEMLENLQVLMQISAHEHFIEFCSHKSFKTYINRQLSNSVIQWFTLPQLAFITDMTKTFLSLTHIRVCVNWQSTITGNQCGDLMSTQWCCPGLMSLVIWQCVNVWAVSNISKDHGAFIHKTPTVQQKQPTGPFRAT